MTAENAGVRAIRDKLAQEKLAGEMEGYDAAPTARAEFCRLFYKHHTPKQRGYILGHMLAEWERERATQDGIVSS
jgi:hypothetical protein